MSSNICEIEKLVELFGAHGQNEDEDDSEKEETIVAESAEKTKQSETNKAKKNPYAKLETETKNREYLDAEEYFLNEETSSKPTNKEWKKTPIWDISYKQNVSTEDMFLGTGFKNPSTASCEDMIVTIYLPGEKRQNVDLKVEEKNLVLDSPKFYLNIVLPQRVDPKRGSAQFDKDNEKLIVSLVMNRDLDFLNF